jgi:beta-lactamase class A
VLLVVAIVLGVGPGQLREFAAGLLFVRPPAAAITPAPSHADTTLQSRMSGLSQTLTRGRLSAAAMDLQSGAFADLDGARPLPAASLFKLPILVQVLAEEDAGHLDPDQLLEIRQEDWTDGSGVLQARVGERLSIRELTRLMIEQSDNIAALVLLDKVGVSNTNATAAQLGLTQTHLVDRRAGEDGDHTTSAEDMAHLMLDLASGEAVNQRVSEQALSLLEAKQSANWLGDDLPFWVKLAHKWGDLPEARHDAGVVFAPRGSYAIAVLTDGAPPEEAAAAIARVSRTVYDFVGAGG